jgi:mannose-1-phosphate guanylyltransferase
VCQIPIQIGYNLEQNIVKGRVIVAMLASKAMDTGRKEAERLHLILLSGGSGKRLWPLSNGVRAKQFLKLLRADDGSMESMAQRVCRQLTGTQGIAWDSVTVVAGAAQKDQLSMQLPKSIDIIIEPERRDTFPAISYAVSQLFDRGSIARDDAIAVIPVDPFVEPQFFDRIALIESEIATTGADIVLLGNKPFEATEKFGYIIVKEEADKAAGCESLPVVGFKEKPQALEAQELIKNGALWNCGVFGMKAGYILDFLEGKHGIKKFDPHYMANAFKTLPKISFDYEVVERARNIRVIEYAGNWKDLGTWESLTEEMSEFSLGDVIKDDISTETHVLNELEIPVAVLGAKNFVIVAGNDGILVASKNDAYRLKELVADFDVRPMHEKKRWGEYLVLCRTSSGAGGTLTKKLILHAGKQISYQIHNHRKEIWTVLSGEGVLYLEGEKRKVFCGDTITIEAGIRHGLHALTEMEVVEVQFGRPLVEDDIVRVELEWDPETI